MQKLNLVVVLFLVGGALWWSSNEMIDALQLSSGRKKPYITYDEYRRRDIDQKRLTVQERERYQTLEQRSSELRVQLGSHDSPAARCVLGQILAERVGLIYRKGEVEEAAEILGKCYQDQPEDVQIAGALGDLYFDQREFESALEIYRKILVLNEEFQDKGGSKGSLSRTRKVLIEARVGSVLTILGRKEESVEVLSRLVESNPRHFQARAYLSLALAQAGRIVEARESARRAADLAPVPDARERMLQFFGRLGGQVSVSNQKEIRFQDWLRQHPIIGPKLVDVNIVEGNVTVVVQSFPVESMPPFAKEKLENRLLDFAKRDSLSEIDFVDSDSRAVLLKVVSPD